MLAGRRAWSKRKPKQRDKTSNKKQRKTVSSNDREQSRVKDNNHKQTTRKTKNQKHSKSRSREIVQSRRKDNQHSPTQHITTKRREARSNTDLILRRERAGIYANRLRRGEPRCSDNWACGLARECPPTNRITQIARRNNSNFRLLACCKQRKATTRTTNTMRKWCR